MLLLLLLLSPLARHLLSPFHISAKLSSDALALSQNNSCQPHFLLQLAYGL